VPFPLFADTAMTCIHHLIDHHQTSLRKTASYYLVHIVVAAAVICRHRQPAPRWR
jgi:hypothetical protein